MSPLVILLGDSNQYHLSMHQILFFTTNYRSLLISVHIANMTCISASQRIWILFSMETTQVFVHALFILELNAKIQCLYTALAL